MEFLSNLPDNQLALLGCAFALSASGLLMAVSYYAGRHSFQQTGKGESDQIAIAGSVADEIRNDRPDEGQAKPTRHAA